MLMCIVDSLTVTSASRPERSVAVICNVLRNASSTCSSQKQLTQRSGSSDCEMSFGTLVQVRL